MKIASALSLSLVLLCTVSVPGAAQQPVVQPASAKQLGTAIDSANTRLQRTPKTKKGAPTSVLGANAAAPAAKLSDKAKRPLPAIVGTESAKSARAATPADSVRAAVPAVQRAPKVSKVRPPA